MLINPDCVASLHEHGVRNSFSAQPCHSNELRASALPASFVTQGLVDLQINGFAGVDYNNPEASPEAIDTSLQVMLATGVTRCLPTVITADLESQCGCFQALEKAREQSALARAMIAGYHLEGPFLNPEPGYAGCHPAQDMRAGDLGYFERVQEAANGLIRLVTVAPERPGVIALIRKLVDRGIRVSIGHSCADFDTLKKAVQAGATMSTHLGNGVTSTVTKSDNTVLSQLATDELAASFIADGVHVRRHVLKVYLRAKSTARTILVTDGTAGSAADPGNYTLGKIEIERQQEPIVYITGTESLAGSAATLDACVRNVVHWYGVPMDEAVDWASRQARSLIGLNSEPQADELAEWVWWKTVDGVPQVARAQVGEWVAEPQSTK